MAIMSELQTLIFPLFYSFFFISIPKVNLIPQFINVIATNNDLLMDELNVIYFALKIVATSHDMVTSNY